MRAERPRTLDLPSITIVTPTLNHVRYIETSIRSVLAQGYPRLEYVVVDGGSTDGTQAVLARFGDRLQWSSEPDRGQSDAINKGLRRARGEVRTYLNSDDALEPGSLWAVGQYFAEHPGALWVAGRTRLVDEQGRSVRGLVDAYRTLWLRHFRTYAALRVQNFIPQPGTFWRREATDRIGLFREDLHLAMDYDYWLRLWELGEPGYIERYLGRVCVHKNTKSERLNAAQFHEVFAISRSRGGALLPAVNRLHGLGAGLAHRVLFRTPRA